MSDTREIDPAWLATTWFFDHDAPSVVAFVDEHTAGIAEGDDGEATDGVDPDERA